MVGDNAGRQIASNAGTRWEQAGRASPRVAHRLVSAGSNILVIGGANGGKNLDSIEAIPIR